MGKVRNFLIIINVKPSGFPVDIRSNLRPLLETMLRCPKCYDVSLTDSTNGASNGNLNRKLVNKWSIGRIVGVVS